MSSSILYWLIVACETSFWALLIAGLTSRYILQRKILSSALLLALPAVDVVLFVVTTLDLKSGAPATFAHGLAAAYVGFTVAFGSMTVAWADKHFAHWFVGAPAPPKAPAHGWPALQYEMRLWVRCLVAVAITLVLLSALIAFVDDDHATKALREWLIFPVGVAVFWFIFGPLWTLVFSSRRRGDDA
jgi:hypothetical protein